MKVYNITSEKTFREPPLRSTAFELRKTDDPCVFVAVADGGRMFDVAGADRRDCWIKAACIIHRCPNPIQPETE